MADPLGLPGQILRRVWRAYPAVLGFTALLTGLGLGFGWLSCGIFLTLLATFRMRGWWLVFLLAFGMWLQAREAQKAAWWFEFFSSQGYAEMEFSWAEDVYLSQGEYGRVQGQAFLRPLQADRPAGFSRRFWVILEDAGGIQRDHMVQGVTWRAKLLVAGSGEPRVLKIAGIDPSTCGISRIMGWRRSLVLHLESAWARHGQEDRVALIRGLLTGNRHGMDESVMSDFSRLGLQHLLALSGMNVACLFAFFHAVLSRVPLAGRVPGFISLLLVAAYGVMGGWAHSLARAVAMCALAVWALHLGRRARLLNILAFVAMVEVARDPAVLGNLSFQLSYLGVAGIAWVLALKSALPFPTRSPWRWMNGTIDAHIISWGAMLFTWPVVALNFMVVPTWAWLVSIPVLSLFSIVVVLAFGAGVWSFMGLALPWWTLAICSAFEGLTAFLSDQFAWVARIGNFNAAFLPVYFAALWFLLWFMSWHQHLRMPVQTEISADVDADYRVS